MATDLTPDQWNEQFLRQAGWTRAMRSSLYRRANLLRARRVLDVGSGTGCVTKEVAARTQGQVIGVDSDPGMVAFAQKQGGQAEYRVGDVHALPFENAHFDVTLCHFLLLWCREPAMAAREMVRVTKPGGTVLICAEPDYGGRIDYPDLPLGEWQMEALRREGADPCLGRKLRGLFHLPEVRQVEIALIPGIWDLVTLRSEFEAEWELWEQSLAGLVPAEELARAKAVCRQAVEAGHRLVYVPTFCALVRV